MHHCSCGATWTGASRCHCPSCHLTFSGLATFDRHQDRSRREDGVITCRPPGSVDLVRRESIGGTYYGHPPMTDEQLAARGWKRDD